MGENIWPLSWVITAEQDKRLKRAAEQKIEKKATPALPPIKKISPKMRRDLAIAKAGANRERDIHAVSTFYRRIAEALESEEVEPEYKLDKNIEIMLRLSGSEEEAVVVVDRNSIDGGRLDCLTKIAPTPWDRTLLQSLRQRCINWNTPLSEKQSQMLDKLFIRYRRQVQRLPDYLASQHPQPLPITREEKAAQRWYDKEVKKVIRRNKRREITLEKKTKKEEERKAAADRKAGLEAKKAAKNKSQRKHKSRPKRSPCKSRKGRVRGAAGGTRRGSTQQRKSVHPKASTKHRRKSLHNKRNTAAVRVRPKKIQAGGAKKNSTAKAKCVHKKSIKATKKKGTARRGKTKAPAKK